MIPLRHLLEPSSCRLIQEIHQKRRSLLRLPRHRVGTVAKGLRDTVIISIVTTDTMSSDKASTPAAKTDSGNGSICAGSTKYAYNMPNDAIKVLEQGTTEFVLSLVKSDKFRYKKPEDPVKLRGRVTREERELERKIREKLADDAVAEKIKSLNETIARLEEVVGLPRQAVIEWNDAVAEEVTAPAANSTSVSGDGEDAEKMKRLEEENKRLKETVARLEDQEESRKAEMEQKAAGMAAARASKSTSGHENAEEVEKKQDLEEEVARLAQAEESRQAWLECEAAEKVAAFALIQMSTAPIDSRRSAEAGSDKAIIPGEPETAATSEPVSTPKPRNSSADIPQPAVEKLDAPTTLATSTGTSDEILAGALCGITISKTKAPTAETPAPQNQPPPNAKPSPANPFYRSDMTLALAAQNIVAYFREAADWLNFWHISTSAPMLLEISRKPASTLNRIVSHLMWTAELLRFGREGWDLRHLPDNFFEDVLPWIMVTSGKLEKLGEWKGCEGMMGRAWRDAEEVGEMLVTVRNVRVRERKEKWARGLGSRKKNTQRGSRVLGRSDKG
jgi:hypothetical protein